MRTVKTQGVSEAVKISRERNCASVGEVETLHRRLSKDVIGCTRILYE